MDAIKFDREKKGYSAQQVDSYISMLQKHYQELEQKREEYQIILPKLQKQAEQKKQGMVQIRKMVEEKQKQLHVLEEETRNSKLELRNLEKTYGQTGQNIHRLHEKLGVLKQEQEARLKQEPSDETAEPELLTFAEQLQAAKEQSANLRREKESLADRVSELTRQIEGLETKAADVQEKEGQDDFEKLQFIFVEARQKANTLVEEIKKQTAQEVDDVKQKCHYIITGAKETAERILAEIRKEQTLIVEDKRARVEAQDREFRQEKEQYLDQCEKIRLEAEQKKVAAMEKAGQIEEETQRSLEAIEQKEKIVVERVLLLINQKKHEIAKGFQTIESDISDTMMEIKDMMSEVR